MASSLLPTQPRVAIVPLLAGRDAGRRARRRAADQAVSRGRHLHPRLCSGRDVGHHPRATGHDQLHQPPAGGGQTLSEVSAADAAGARTARPARLRPRHQQRVGAGQGRHRPARRAPPLLLPLADAVPVGSLSRLSRHHVGPVAAGDPVAVPRRPQLGRDLGESRRPLRRQFELHPEADQPRLAPRGVGGPSAGRGRPVSVRATTSSRDIFGSAR